MMTKNRVPILLTSLVFFMLSASFAAVPFYNWFCKVTGYGGTPVSSTENYSGEIIEQEIKVRFDASKAKDMLWEFSPLQDEIHVKLGETALVFYEAYNPTNKTISGQASFNIFPFSAGSYFSKIECFCFVEQKLEPGERVKMPVTFYIDPDIINNIETKGIKTLTLSYTFYKLDDKLQS